MALLSEELINLPTNVAQTAPASAQIPLSQQLEAIDTRAALKALETPSIKDLATARSTAGSIGTNLGNMFYGATKGMADIVQAPAQLILNSAAALSGEGPASQYVKQKAQDFNRYLTNQENQYQAETPGSGAAGLGRAGASIAPFLAAAPTSVASAIPMAQKLARGLTQGAIYSQLQPVLNAESPAEFLSSKAVQTGLGAGLGAAAAPIGSAISKFLNPTVNPQVQKLVNEGITPTAGKILGGGFARTEAKLSSYPVTGDLMAGATRREIEDLNKATYNRALRSIGEVSTKPAGFEGVYEVQQKLGNFYDSLLPKLTFKADEQFLGELGAISRSVGNGELPQQQVNQFDNIIKNQLIGKMDDDATIAGKSFKRVEEALNDLSKQYGKSGDTNDRLMGNKIGEVLTSARESLQRTNPEYAADLKAANAGWAQYNIIRSAAKNTDKTNGVFNPSQFSRAVYAEDQSARKGRNATGRALMQDLSSAANSILSPKYPDSGTVGRALIAAAPTAGLSFMSNPLPAIAIGGATLAATAPYTQIGQRIAAQLLTSKRPPIVAPIANTISNLAPLGGAMLAPTFNPGTESLLDVRR